MSSTVVDTSRLRKGVRNRLKGRQVDPRAAGEIATLLGDAPRERDHLIEHLHRIQDRYGCLSAAHLAALAAEMRLAMTEVYEVATFYHHFDVVKENEVAPPTITVRVCDTLSCRMAGADALRAELALLEARGVRVLPAPCIGRCEQAPAVAVHQHALARATLESVLAAVAAGARTPALEPTSGVDEYEAGGGDARLRDCVRGVRAIEDVIAVLEHSGLRGLGGA